MNKLLALALLCASTANAAFFDGNALHRQMQDDRTLAIGFVMGVHDALDGEAVCSPVNVTSGQVTDIVAAFLVRRPEARHEKASVLVAAVLVTTWPCAKARTGKNT